MAWTIDIVLALLPHAVMAMYAHGIRAITPYGISLGSAYIVMIPMAGIALISMLGIGVVTSAVNPDNYLLWCLTLLAAEIYGLNVIWSHVRR